MVICWNVMFGVSSSWKEEAEGTKRQKPQSHRQGRAAPEEVQIFVSSENRARRRHKSGRARENCRSLMKNNVVPGRQHELRSLIFHEPALFLLYFMASARGSLPSYEWGTESSNGAFRISFKLCKRRRPRGLRGNAAPCSRTPLILQFCRTHSWQLLQRARTTVKRKYPPSDDEIPVAPLGFCVTIIVNNI